MLLRDQVKWVLVYCKKNIFESLIVTIITAFGVGVIIVLISFVLQANELVNNYDALGRDREFRIRSGNYSLDPALAFYSASESVKEDMLLCQGLDNLKKLQDRLPPNFLAFALHYISGEVSIERENKLYNAALSEAWLTPEAFIARDLKLEKGNYFLQADLEFKNRVVVLSSWLARELFGATEPIGKVIKWSSIFTRDSFEVIGVLEPLAKDLVFSDNYKVGAYFPISISPNTDMDTGQTSLDSILVMGNSKLTISENIKIIEDAARAIIDKPLTVYHSGLANLETLQINQKLAFLFGVLASIAIVISVANVMNLTISRVLKREKFIGLKITLGCSQGLIFRYFILEILVLGIFGSLLGLLIARQGILFLGKIFMETYFKDFSLSLGIIGLIAGLFMSLLFGLYPAFLSMKVSPIDALRKE